MSYLRRSAPKIWQLSCGEYVTVLERSPRFSRSKGSHKDISPTGHGDKDKSKSEAPSQITVAALSKFDMPNEFESEMAPALLTLVGSPSNHRGDRKILVPSNSGDANPTTFLNAVGKAGKHFLSTRQKEQLGDAKLQQVRDLVLDHFRSKIEESEIRVIEEKIT